MLDRFLKEKQGCNVQFYSEWILKNIYCISKYLGASYFGYEEEILSLFTELKTKMNDKNKSKLLLESGKKKQHERGSRELKRLKFSISDDERSRKNKGSGEEDNTSQ